MDKQLKCVLHHFHFRLPFYRLQQVTSESVDSENIAEHFRNVLSVEFDTFPKIENRLIPCF